MQTFTYGILYDGKEEATSISVDIRDGFSEAAAFSKAIDEFTDRYPESEIDSIFPI